MSECALWYVRYGVPDYDLFDSEEDAAKQGVWMEEDGTASVLGVQFPDGRTVDRKAWPAWHAAGQEMERRYQARREEAARKPKPIMRETRDPFEGRTLQVEASEPQWVGKGA